MTFRMDLIEKPEARDHFVQLYEKGKDDELAESVARFLHSGLSAGQGCAVVATPGHWDRFRKGLEAAGMDVDAHLRSGQLEVRDAEATLALLTIDGLPDPGSFSKVILPVVQRLRQKFPGGPVRAYGEMVDLLWDSRQMGAAQRLETMWDGLIREEGIVLFCAYRLSLFDLPTEADAIDAVARSHGHLIPCGDPARLERAFERALDDVFGPADAQHLSGLSGRDLLSRGESGGLEGTLLWLRKNFPEVLARLLASARRLYENPGASPTA